MLDHKYRKRFCTGDVPFRKQTILSGGQCPGEESDALVMETTRGATERTEQKQKAGFIGNRAPHHNRSIYLAKRQIPAHSDLRLRTRTGNSNRTTRGGESQNN
jgi:hypothetical protein